MSIVQRLFPETLVSDPFADFFNDVIYTGANRALRSYQPAMDLIETKDNYCIKANVPGFEKDQIEVSATGSTLTIKGHYEKSDEKKDENHIRRERVESSFQRSVSVPMTIDPEKIKASIKNGVLEVLVPKEQPKSNRIAINWLV